MHSDIVQEMQRDLFNLRGAGQPMYKFPVLRKIVDRFSRDHLSRNSRGLRLMIWMARLLRNDHRMTLLSMAALVLVMDIGVDPTQARAQEVPPGPDPESAAWVRNAIAVG